jgi:hypothetical protein
VATEERQIERVWHGGPWEQRPTAKRSAELPFTPRELEILESVVQSRGWAWAFRHAWLCIDQARALGTLPQEGPWRWPVGFLCGTRPGRRCT